MRPCVAKEFADTNKRVWSGYSLWTTWQHVENTRIGISFSYFDVASIQQTTWGSYPLYSFIERIPFDLLNIHLTESNAFAVHRVSQRLERGTDGARTKAK